MAENNSKANAVHIIGKIKNLDTGKRLVRFSVSDGKDCTIATVSREEFFANKNVLNSYGAVVGTFKDISASLQEEEQQLNFEYIFNNLGWSFQGGRHVFKGYKLFGKERLCAKYNGSLHIQPKGSFEAWRSGILQFAMPQVPLQTAIAVGASALLEGMLADELDSSFILHLMGESSKGKTTFAKLALSVACSPQPIKGNSFFCDWNSTNNYKLSLLKNNYGFPVVFDEISQAKTKTLTDFVYDVANRQERGRLNSDSSQKEVATWSTTVISTGEESLLGKCNNNNGLLVRVLELEFEQITADARSAEALMSVIINNYGQAYPKILEYFFEDDNRIAEIRQRFLDKRAQLSEEFGAENALANRLMKHIAIILLSAEICGEVLDLDFDIEAIKQELFRAVREQNRAFHPDETLAVLSFLNETYLANTGRFTEINLGRTEFPKILSKNAIGYVEYKTDGITLFFIPKEFEKVIFNCSVNNKTKALKLLKKGGYLQYERDRLTKKRTFNGTPQRLYEIFIPESAV